mgnify:CR=1 FL=1
MIVLVSVIHGINSSDFIIHISNLGIFQNFIKSNVKYTSTDCEDHIVDIDEEKEANMLPPEKDFDG